MRPIRRIRPGITVYEVPKLGGKYGRHRVRVAPIAQQERKEAFSRYGVRLRNVPVLTKAEQIALSKWRFKQRVRRLEQIKSVGQKPRAGMLTPEWLYMRKNTTVPEGIGYGRFVNVGARILSRKWFDVEKEKFLAKRGTNPQAGMTMRQRIYGRQFKEAAIKRQIIEQKRFAFELLTQHLPEAERDAFLRKWLSPKAIPKTIPTRELVRYKTIPEVRTETIDNLYDLRGDKEMSSGYTHTQKHGAIICTQGSGKWSVVEKPLQFTKPGIR